MTFQDSDNELLVHSSSSQEAYWVLLQTVYRTAYTLHALVQYATCILSIQHPLHCVFFFFLHYISGSHVVQELHSQEQVPGIALGVWVGRDLVAECLSCHSNGGP